MHWKHLHGHLIHQGGEGLAAQISGDDLRTGHMLFGGWRPNAADHAFASSYVQELQE